MKKYNKYLDTKKYINKILDITVNFLLLFKKPLILKTSCCDKKISFNISSPSEYYLRYKNSYISEISTVEWISNIDYNSSIIWDIGANVGAYSLLMGKKINEKSNTHIYAFEPEAANYHSLNTNIRINGLENKISALSLAISNTSKVGEFFLSAIEVGSATHSLNMPVSEGIPYTSKFRQATLAVSGDDLLNLFKIPAPNYLKIDVDGHELEVLMGMDAVLKSSSLKSIVIEIAQWVSLGRVERLLESYSFAIESKELVCVTHLGNIINCIYVKN